MQRSTASRALALTVLVLFNAVALGAQPTVLKNDSIDTITPSGAIQSGFVDGESAAAWLTSPCDGDLTAVQVLWLSFTGGAPQSIEESIRVYDSGTFPVPGSQLVELLGPLMTDGFFNEFVLPMPVPVSNGDELVLEFTFFNTPPVTGPSVVTDVDGCQAGKNGLFAIPPSAWFSSCLLGLSGDFAIRGVVDCEIGAPVPIFSDGFEAGNTSAWGVVVP